MAGEVRLIYARNRATGDLWLLPDGTADDHRSWTRSGALRCPIPDCDDPALTTVSRVRGRDGFRHTGRDAGGHAPEGVFHVQAAEMIARYLRGLYPESTVTKEEPSDARRSRVADVMIRAVSGARVAFEIQYAGLRHSSWTHRHDSYAEQGISDLWLFGHAGPQLRPGRGTSSSSSSRVTVSPVHLAAAGPDHVALWVNPLTEQLATVVDRISLDGIDYEVPAAGPTGELVIMDLTEFRLGADGHGGHRFTCDRVEQIMAGARTVRRLADEAAAVEAARVAAEEAVARVSAARAAAEAAVVNARTAAALAAADAREPAWLASDLRAQILNRFDGRWPAWLSVPTTPTLPIPVEEWQGTAYAALIADRAHGTTVLPTDCATVLGRKGDPAFHTAVRQWFSVLIDELVLSSSPLRPTRPHLPSPGLTYRTVDHALLRQRDEAAAAARAARAIRSGRPAAVTSGPGCCDWCGNPLTSEADRWRGTHRECD